MQKAEEILAHELIGLQAIVHSSPNKSLYGISGNISFETKQTLQITSDRGIKIIPKLNTNFILNLPHGACFISGTKLIGRPEDRISRVS